MEHCVAALDDIIKVAPRKIQWQEVKVVPRPGSFKVPELLSPPIIVVEAVNADDFTARLEQSFAEM